MFRLSGQEIPGHILFLDGGSITNLRPLSKIISDVKGVQIIINSLIISLGIVFIDFEELLTLKFVIFVSVIAIEDIGDNLTSGTIIAIDATFAEEATRNLGPGVVLFLVHVEKHIKHSAT